MQTLAFPNPSHPPLPAKVTFKKSNKKYTKTYKCKVTVKNPGVQMAESAMVAVNGTVSVKSPKSWPTTSTVTYASDKTDIATVDAATGEVTGVKAGEATITATLVCGSKTVTKSTKVTVKNYVFESVKQTKADELEAVINGNTKDIKATDIRVENVDTKMVYHVYKVTPDAKEPTKVTLTLFNQLVNSEKCDVTLDKVTKSFVASNGQIASINVDPVTIPYATETAVSLVSKDANGVILKEIPYGQGDSNYSFTINTNGNGYTANNRLSLNKIGDTATAEIAYRSGKYDASGKPEGNIGPNKVTITAVDQSVINSFNVRVDSYTAGSYDKAKDSKQIAVEDDHDLYAYFKIQTVNGVEISSADYSKYTVESSDKTALMLESSKIKSYTGTGYAVTRAVKVRALKPGTVYILIKDQKGAIVGSVSIDVVAKRAVASMELSSYDVAVSNSTKLNQTKPVTVTLRDQYGAKMSNADSGISVTYLDSNNATANDPGLVTPKNSSTSLKVCAVVNNKGVAEGVYNYKVAYSNYLGEVVARTLTVVVQDPKVNIADGYRLDINKLSVDLKDVVNDIAKAPTTLPSIDVNLIGTANGVDLENTTGVEYTVTKINDPTFKPVTRTSKVTSGAGITLDSATGTLKINPVTTSTSGTSISVTSALKAGTYEVEAVYQRGTANEVRYTRTFDVKDSIGKASATIVQRNFVLTQSGSLRVKNALQQALRVSYNGKTYEYAGTPATISKAKLLQSAGITPLTENSSITSVGNFVITDLEVQVVVATNATTNVLMGIGVDWTNENVIYVN